MRYIICILSILLAAIQLSAQSNQLSQLDSLRRDYYALSDNDTLKLSVAQQIGDMCGASDSALIWYDNALDIAKKHKDRYAEGHALASKGCVYFFMSEYDKSLNAYFKALYFFENLDNCQKDIVDCHLMIGNNYYELQMFEVSDNHYLKGADISRVIADTVRLSACIRNLAGNYFTQKIYSRAEKLFQEAFHLDSITGNKRNLLCTFNNMANMYLTQYYEGYSEVDSALILKSKKMSDLASKVDTTDLYQLFWSYNIYVEAMFAESLTFSKYPQSRKDGIRDSVRFMIGECQNFLKSIEIGEDMYNYKLREVDMYILEGNLQRARFMLDSLAVAVDEVVSLKNDRLIDLYLTYYYYYLTINDMQSAMDYKIKYFELKFRTTSIDYAVTATESLAESEFKERVRLQTIENERKKLYAYFGFAGLVLVLIFLSWEYYRKHRHNQMLNEKNVILMQQKEEILSQKEEILAQSDELQEKNEQILQTSKQVTDSINYASLIQKAVLPSSDTMSAMFSDYFLIYRPLNIVAGDFYWVTQIGGLKVIVCADCTGHGVPGAFVSMLGISLLNEIVPSIVSSGGNAADILNMLRQKVMKSLGQNVELYAQGKVSNMDGMDLALIILDSDTRKIQYAGALRPLWIYRDGQIIVYSPDKMPIGLYWGNLRNFTCHDIQLNAGDIIYMFSDGIPDQFGFDDDNHESLKHYSNKRLMELLSGIGDKPLQDQQRIIEETIDQWKNGYRQIDDNIMLGIKVE